MLDLVKTLLIAVICVAAFGAVVVASTLIVPILLFAGICFVIYVIIAADKFDDEEDHDP